MKVSEFDFDLPPDVIPAVVPEFPASVQAGLFYKIMGVIYRNFESPGAACLLTDSGEGPPDAISYSLPDGVMVARTTLTRSV